MHPYSSVSISTRNLKCLASPNYKDMLEAIFKTGNVTLTTPLLGVIYHHRLGFDTVYMRAKFQPFQRYHWGVKI